MYQFMSFSLNGMRVSENTIVKVRKEVRREEELRKGNNAQ